MNKKAVSWKKEHESVCRRYVELALDEFERGNDDAIISAVSYVMEYHKSMRDILSQVVLLNFETKGGLYAMAARMWLNG